MSSLKIATSRAGAVGTAVGGTGVVEGADGADRVGGWAPGGNMAEAPAVPTLRIRIGGVGPLDWMRWGERSDGEAHGLHVPGMHRDND